MQAYYEVRDLASVEEHVRTFRREETAQGFARHYLGLYPESVLVVRATYYPKQKKV